MRTWWQHSEKRLGPENVLIRVSVCQDCVSVCVYRAIRQLATATQLRQTSYRLLLRHVKVCDLEPLAWRALIQASSRYLFATTAKKRVQTALVFLQQPRQNVFSHHVLRCGEKNSVQFIFRLQQASKHEACPVPWVDQRFGRRSLMSSQPTHKDLSN